MKREIEVYIHIPFCVKKCAYCDFLSGPADKEVQNQYMEALIREIASFGQQEEPVCEKEVFEVCSGYEVVSVFFGGGTPSVLDADWIGRILQELRKKFIFRKDAEISIECNPGTADQKKLEKYREFGINRISFGLQSADNRELQLLGRIHSWEQFLETFCSARRAGFSNINVDLMSALPGQSIDSWERTLEKVLALEPEHISAYSLIIEVETPFYERYAEDVRLREEGGIPHVLPSEEEEREMYQMTEKRLLDADMYRYEISNYARKGYECRHNIGYWTGTEYVGFGLGASSYLKLYEMEKQTDSAGMEKRIRTVRMQNTTDMEAYVKEDFSYWKNNNCFSGAAYREVLSEEDQMAEFMFLGLRMMNGVSEEEFAQKFGRTIDTVYGPVIRRQCELGLLRREKGRIFLSNTGIDLSNTVMAEFLL